jgi:hypothetical protein
MMAVAMLVLVNNMMNNVADEKIDALRQCRL